MEIPFLQIDAFTDQIFSGNPAAVCPLDYWISDANMQAIAAENNLSETAFYVPEGDDWGIRWFTPAIEVPLCGHATLATAWAIFQDFPLLDRITFQSKSGPLPVRRRDELIELDFPARPPSPCDLPVALEGRVGRPVFIGEDPLGTNLFLVYDDPAVVLSFIADRDALMQMPHIGLIVTAPGVNCDFISRYFAPRAGIDEDPVTGSAHTTLVPYWAERFESLSLHARQVSRRGGELFCKYSGDRVLMGGHCALYSRGRYYLP